MKRVLFKIDTGTYYTGLVKIALAVQATDRFEPVMFFNNDHPSMAVHIDDSRRKNLMVITGLTDQTPGSTYQYNSTLQRLPRKQSRLVERLNAFNPFDQYLKLRNKQSIIEKFLTTNKFDLLVYGGENAWYDTAIYNKVARQFSIPTVAFPQWMAGPREPGEHIYDDPEYSLHRPLNRLIGWFWPRWTLEYREKKLIRLPAREVIAREMLGIAPPLPWVLHSGQTNIIALENRAMYEAGKKFGLSEKQMEIIGSIEHDILANGLRQTKSLRHELLTELGLPVDRPMLLSAVPPDFLTGSRLSTCEFKTYKDLLTYWVTTLLGCSTHAVVFHLHPSMTAVDAAIIKGLGGKISSRSISELIPLADIFVASISSTIQWAIASGLPVVNYDLYRYRYHDYDAAPGVITIEEQNDFQQALTRITTDTSYQAHLRARQNTVRTAWGVLDGQAKLRIIGLFDRLTAHRLPRY